MKILCTICARGGSKGIKNKNLKIMNKKPLIYYTIEHAKKVKIFEEILISSDSEKIVKYGKKLKLKNSFLRPKNLAKNNSAKIPTRSSSGSTSSRAT